MANGEETRGQVAKTMAGAGGVEIKATIPPQQVDVALKAYHLEVGRERSLHLLLRHARTSRSSSKASSPGPGASSAASTTARSSSARSIRPRSRTLWRKYSGFKIEADTSDKGVVKSASLTMPVAKGLIKRVAAEKNPIADLFTEEQLLFLLSLANKKMDYSKVVVLGPVRPGDGNTRTRACPGRSGRTLAARRRRAALRGLDQGPGRPGRGGEGRLHGLPGRGRRRARSTASRPRPAGSLEYAARKHRQGGEGRRHRRGRARSQPAR